uniref:CRAL-TRIO domain-containing protein n=1 Tax=Percolomonas cosmopolitus TaxID=63605 RepID=A0A7S1KQY5_9EUKA|mmetsp:Transcript_5093/g.19096  ORF Transcript_5093/g.19096 Transcript_5093/m.19096 type:complete len:290 (+) Transcript_5093:80-949(+)|eukprot:CAMPEP_0117442998 /NCGR_PEP_ID=MMETSP0759-20121206/4456_1 /TAXON_ID=63605 /ORGANISM="Percolomonas cosmopolitus, Strain WS" /LENGTH=289 /DNA_ID=CAMNT_0005234935 /DNA_START=80 /DNA_END=949 /DNA_ORIENTATION=+
MSSSSLTAHLRHELSPDQCEILNEFIKEIDSLDLTRKQRKFCTEDCLIRYLRAREFVLAKSLKMLKETLEWRESFRPDEIDPKDLTLQAESGKSYVDTTFSKKGNALVFFTPSRENSTDWTKNVKLTVFCLEQAISQMKSKGVDKLILFMDFSGYSRKNAPPFHVSREVLHILSNHYPERLQHAFMVNTPMIFNLFWNLISPFLHHVTREKIQFVRKRDFHVLQEYVDADSLQKRFGGNREEPEIKMYWQSVIDMHIQREKRKQDKRERHQHQKMSRHERTISGAGVKA